MTSKVKDVLLETSSEESGSEDDEEAWKLTDEVEKEFFKTLSQIKSKNPKIYQKDIEFFKNVTVPEEKPKEKPKVAPFTLREYERKIVVEKGGELSDEEPPAKSMVPVSYVEEQRALKNSLKNLLQSDSEYESEAEWGGLFKKRQKSTNEKEKEEEDYKEWLKGQKSEVPEDEAAKEMKPLRDFWTNPQLNQEDQFLRDYILNKRFLESDDKGDSGVDVNKLEDESEDKNTPNLLGRNPSHRFEEADQDFIKRYPRVMQNSVRRKDDSRKRKREEIKERKVKDKERKKAEVKQKQKLKKKEIEQKLEEIKNLTGNDKLAFENVLDADFDIDEHDKAMQKLFNEEFYSQDDPNFNPNETSAAGDWNEEEGEDLEGNADNYDNGDEGPQCEDPDFNMDCDYDPATQRPKQKNPKGKRRREKHRRNTVSEAVRREKPVFDPATHKSYQEYLDQYYGIHCEDFIGDLPCRFKYRRTTPNSYGLTIEEILAADPKELERWCSIKRIVQLKPVYKEKGDAMSFKKRAEDEELKRKILPSLFKTQDEENPTSTELPEDGNESGSKNKLDANSQQSTKNKKKELSLNNNLGAKNNNKKRKFAASEMVGPPSKNIKLAKNIEKPNKAPKNKENNKNTKKIVNQKIPNEKSTLIDMSDARLQAYGIKPKQFRNKLIYNGVGTNRNKSGKNDSHSKKNLKKKKTNANISDKGNTEGHRQAAKKSIKKKTNKLSNKKKSGWVISNAS